MFSCSWPSHRDGSSAAEELLKLIWGYTHGGYRHTVDTHINRLRQRVELDPANPELILTVWGVGYKFTDVADAG